MKTHISTAVVLVGLLSLAGSAAVNTEELALSARVPFDFTAGTAKLAAGTYTITRPTMSPNVILIRSVNQGAFLVADRSYGPARNEPQRLVFHRYENHHFLRGVSFGGGLAMSLPETAEEREWAAARNRKVASGPTVVHVPVAVE